MIRSGRRRPSGRMVARFLAGLLFSGVFVVGSAVDLAAQIPISQMDHKSWTPREGAPANIEDIVQGTDGFLWLTTDDGLYRFDGVAFGRYVPPAGSALLSENFTSINATRDGSLWLSYLTNGLARIKDGHITNYTEREGLPNGQIISVVEREDGSFWAGGVSGLLKITDSRLVTTGAAYGMPAGPVQRLAEDSDGNLWAAQQYQLMVLPRGASRFLLATSRFSHGQCGLSRSRDGGVWWWCSDSEPLLRFRVSGGKIQQTLVIPHISAWAVRQAGDGAVWIGTESSGLLRFYPSVQQTEGIDPSQVETFDTRDRLTGDFAFRIVEDREGSIWVGTANGLDQFRPVPFRAVDVGQSAPVVLPQGKSDSRFIVASDRVADLTTGLARFLSLRVPEWTRSLYRSEDGTLWIGGNGHLWTYASSRFSPQSLPANLKGSQRPILAIIEDDSHRIWISVGQGNGLFRLDGEHWVSQGGYPEFPHGTALCAARDPSGALWFGYFDGRVVRLDKGRLQKFGQSEGLDAGAVKVFALSGNDVWVGGETGVEVFRRNRFFPLRLEGGEHLRGVTGLAFAPDGALWINQSSGVLRVDKGEIAAGLSDPDYAAKFRSFDSHDGLRGIPHSLVGLGSARMAPDGRLYIATRTNLQWIDPLHLPHNDIPPQVWITGWKADDRYGQWSSSQLTLKPHVENLQIKYTATSLLVPERMRFRYMLEGYDKGWVDAGTRREAFYSKLPPGRYTFRVIASNDSGVWNNSGASVVFSVPPTFTQTIWFQVLCLAVIGCIAALLYRVRVHRVTALVRKRAYERLAERERIARDLHDTFFQGIQGLLLRFHTATSALPKDDPTRRILEDTLKQSDQVMLEGRELVLDLRANTAEQTDLPTVLADYGKQMQKDYGCEFRVLVNGNTRPLLPIACEELSKIGKEALGNAFRHSGARSIEAEVNYEPNQLRIRIRDDGAGIDPNVLQQGRREGHWGLPGMRERAAKIGAQLDIWSRAGAGTEIELRLPGDLAFAADLRRAAFGKLGSRWPWRKTGNDAAGPG